MVRRILRSLSLPIRGLHQAAYTLAGLTLISQLLALLRDRIFAKNFGAGQLLDAYYAAFKIPDLLFALVASLVSAYVLIPQISGLIETEQKEEIRSLISQTTTFLLIAGGGVCFIFGLFAPTILGVLFPSIVAGVYGHDFIILSRVLLMQPIILGLSSI
jgi:putative peptidoglycan lipid II flippase